MMVEIAVDLMLTLNIVMNVCVMNKLLGVNMQFMCSCDQRFFFL